MSTNLLNFLQISDAIKLRWSLTNIGEKGLKYDL